MIGRDFSGAAKTLVTGAGGVTTFSPNEIALRGSVLAWIISFAPTTQTLALLGGIRVKMFGQSIIDLERDQLRAFIEYNRESNFLDPTASSEIVVPMGFDSAHSARDLAARDPLGYRELCAFPRTAAPQIEIVGDGVTGWTAASSVLLSWIWTDREPRFYRRLLRNKLTFAASNNNQKLSFSTTGELRGLVLPSLGLARLRVSQNGADVFHMPGRSYLSAAVFGAGEDPITASLQDNNPCTIQTPLYLPMSAGQPAGPGSYVEMDTGAAWVTTSGTLFQDGADQLVIDELVAI